MFKKIALCAMLVLILVPASVMAAGQQGQAQGIGSEAGNCLNVQQQIASTTVVQEKSQNGQGQSSQSISPNGDMLKLQTRSCDGTCDQEPDMVRNMTRDQVRLNPDAGPASENQNLGSGDALKLQTRSCDGTCDQEPDMVRNMTRDQVRLGSDSVHQQNGIADSEQNGSGLTKGNGQNIFSGFADQLGFQFRNMGGILQALFD